MKQLKPLIIVALLVIIIWIDLPENLPIRFQIGKLKVNTKINPLTVDLRISNMNIKHAFRTHLGLDLQGGSHLLYETDTSKIKQEDLNDALASVRDIIEKRVNYFGVSEPVIQNIKAGNKYRISVDLPGISDVNTAITLIGRTAMLGFFEEGTDSAKIASSSPIFLRLTKDTGLTGKDVKKATVEFDSQSGKPQVGLSFTNLGAKLFGEITQRNIGKAVGIFIDQIPISTPTVQTAIMDGSAVITGNFTVNEAKKLAITINSGALPLPIKLIEQRNIGPTLGASEVKKSIFAGAIGLAMVLFFMIVYYKKLGIIASMALLIYGLLSLAIFRLIPVVLTLSGVAGFILSIGMAVDSNILIFERIKEEQRKGQKFNIAIRVGFGRAIDAIKDANITTLTVAFILFNPLNWEFLPQFGMVRGFALTLAIGVGTSLFTGVVITKRLINLFYKNTQS